MLSIAIQCKQAAYTPITFYYNAERIGDTSLTEFNFMNRCMQYTQSTYVHTHTQHTYIHIHTIGTLADIITIRQ